MTQHSKWKSIVVRDGAAMPAVLIVSVCCVLPLGWMVLAIVLNPHVLRELTFDTFRLHLLGRTLAYNGSVALIATLMGLPAGIVLGRGRGVTARLMWVIVPAALLLPSLSYAYGWKQFVRLLYFWTSERHPFGPG